MRAGFSSDAVCFQLHGVSTWLRFSGSNVDARIEGEDALAGRVNIFSGAAARTGLETYGRIRYRALYPGIDLTYSATGRRIKAEFLIAPGADPTLIQLAYDGEVSIAHDGSLLVRKPGAELREEAPVVLQDGRRIPARYQLIEPHMAGFWLGDYDHSRALVIDPTITYSTYLGGTGMGSVTAIAVDASGDVYVAGYTEALNFPIDGAYQAANKGSVNAFVAKLSAAGTALIYATYVGGNSDDRAWGIALDSSGNAYVAGSTTSTNFPLVSALQSTLQGGRDAFVFKLNSKGNALTYSTLLGGANEDWAYAIALDSADNAYIAGDTMSTNFPVTAGAFQTTQAGQTDAFVTKLTSAGAVVFSTYLGGSHVDHAGGIAIDTSGNVYVAGGTFSTNFPVLTPIQASNAGGENAFATKLKSTGAALAYSTYLGGSSGTAAAPEQANAIAVDASGNAYLAGVTPSTNFPVTTGALQTANNGGADAFVAKIAAAGTLVYSTYLGGSLFDQANSIAIDSSGDAYVAGYTASADFMVVNSIQPVFAGYYDAFVTELGPSGATLIFSTYFGGSLADEANAIAVDSGGNMYVAGQTGSVNLPLTNAYQSVNNGGAIGWAARIGVTNPALLPQVVSLSPSSGSGSTVVYIAQYSDPAGATALLNVALLVNASPSTTFGCFVTYNVASNTFTLADDVPSQGSVTVLPNGASGQNDQCTLNGVGSSATFSGNTLTMTVPLVFSSNFTGSQNVYLWAQDANASTAFVPEGTWTVPVASQIPVPNLVGLTQAAAASGITGAGLVVGTVATGSSTVTAGSVVSESPAAATEVNVGSAVNLFVSAGTAGFSNLHFVPVTPCRIADTRNADGPFGGPSIPASSSRDFTIPSSPCGIPANAAAYSLNLTVVPVGPLGFLSVWPSGQSQPAVSTLNSSDGRIKANAAIVPAGANGAITVFASNPTNVIVDINGYFIIDPANQALAFYPMTPCRIADTRSGSGAFGAPSLAPGVARNFPIQQSACNVPSNAQAYSLNMTVVPSGPLGFLSAWPAGFPQSGSSTLNAPTGTVVANAAIVPAGTGGAIEVIATNPTNLLIDINGYFAPPGSAGALSFYAVTPCRIIDTRGTVGTFGGPILAAAQARTVPVQSSACNIPSSASAYSLNATVVPPAPLGFLSLWGTGGAQPGVSTLNAEDGSIVANAAIVSAGAGGAINAFASNATQLLLDISGYFAP